MPNYNLTVLAGHLTRDPEIKYTPKGTAIASFGLAITERWTNEAGNKMEKTSFIDCEAYGKSAETLGEYVKKGHPLLVQGKLRQDTWETDGQKRSKIKVVVDSFQFLRPAPQSTTKPDASDPARPPSEAPRPPHDPDLDANPEPPF